MAQHHLICESITAQRPVADCYRYLLDFSTVEQWDPSVLAARKLTPGQVAPGSCFEVELTMPGQHSIMTYTLTDAQTDRRLELDGAGPSFRARDVIEFVPQGSRATRIHYRLELGLDAPAWSAGLLQPWLRRMARQSMAGLQAALDPPPPARRSNWRETLSDHLILPAAWNFTRRGYERLTDKSLSHRLDGRVAVVTGPTSGLGRACACELARLGATLVLVGRDDTRLQETLHAVADFADGDVDRHSIVAADLAELDMVRAAAAVIRGLHSRVDVVVNNAGALFADRATTAGGYERTLAINLLAPWLLTHELRELINHRSARVINVASGGMYLQGLALDDMNFAKPAFDGATAYARAKRALVSAGEWLNDSGRLGAATVFSMHPGWAATPGVERSLPAFNRRLGRRLRDPRMGADTINWLATSPSVDTEIGGFWFDRRPHPTAVLPGTAVSAEQQDQLVRWLDDVTGTTGQQRTASIRTAMA